jgi:hypothetical protein
MCAKKTLVFLYRLCALMGKWHEHRLKGRTVPNNDKDMVPFKLCTVRFNRDWQRANRVAPLPLELVLNAYLC